MLKDDLVKKVFNSVANRYDLMNSLMSFGLHRIWKKKFTSMIQPYANHILLDVAGGTGDIAMNFLNKGGGQAIICDINAKMLSIGDMQRIDNGKYNKYQNKLTTIVANAESLPFDNNTFDRVTISFGIRNINNMQLALNEMFRVLKVTGKFLCMEFLCPETNLQKIYNFFYHRYIPLLGQLIVNDKQSYEYFVNSIREFPKQHEFINMLKLAGFEMIKTVNLTPNVVAIYTGYKIF